MKLISEKLIFIMKKRLNPEAEPEEEFDIEIEMEKVRKNRDRSKKRGAIEKQ